MISKNSIGSISIEKLIVLSFASLVLIGLVRLGIEILIDTSRPSFFDYVLSYVFIPVLYLAQFSIPTLINLFVFKRLKTSKDQGRTTKTLLGLSTAVVQIAAIVIITPVFIEIFKLFYMILKIMSSSPN